MIDPLIVIIVVLIQAEMFCLWRMIRIVKEMATQ